MSTEAQNGSEQLQAAQAAFDRGDYAETRSQCLLVERNGSSDEVRQAEALRKRTEVDPVQVAVLAICALFFVVVTWKYIF